MRHALRFSFMIIVCLLPLLGQSRLADSAARFVDNGDGTVTDTRLKIMWQKGDNGKEEVTFEEAQQYCKNLQLGRHSDWRLPKPDERDTATVIQLLMPKRSRDTYAYFDLYWSSEPTVLLPFNYRPSQGGPVSRAYSARQGAKAFVRAVRSLGPNS